MSHKSISKITSTVGFLAVVGICTWAWHVYAGKAPAANDTGAYAKSLESVVIPQGITSEIINYPGFTVSFNKDHGQPNYSIWELTGAESQSNVVGRKHSTFAPDFDVDGCPTLDDYKGSGYDRGHMAPAGDMKWSIDAMNACFLLTNMSPQDHILNTRPWRVLEERCRDWAVRDSAIIIACGPVLTDTLTRTIGVNRVTVPERYFKVVLAPYANPPRGIGFIMPNSPNSGGMQACAVSIDEVERVTGFDFFSALPDDIEEAVESECNFAKWSYKK